MEEALTALLNADLDLDMGEEHLRIHGHAGIRQVDDLVIRWR